MPDLRLASFATGTWLATVVAVRLSATADAALAACGAVAAAGAAWGPAMACRFTAKAPGPGGTVRWILIAAAIGVVCGAATTASRVAIRDAPPTGRRGR